MQCGGIFASQVLCDCTTHTASLGAARVFPKGDDSRRGYVAIIEW